MYLPQGISKTNNQFTYSLVHPSPYILSRFCSDEIAQKSSLIKDATADFHYLNECIGQHSRTTPWPTFYQLLELWTLTLSVIHAAAIHSVIVWPLVISIWPPLLQINGITSSLSCRFLEIGCRKQREAISVSGIGYCAVVDAGWWHGWRCRGKQIRSEDIGWHGNDDVHHASSTFCIQMKKLCIPIVVCILS